MTPVSTPAAAGSVTGRSPAADHGFPRGLFAAVFAGTHLPLLALLAHRAFLPADAADWSAVAPLMTILLPATLLGSVAALWALFRLKRTISSLGDLSRRGPLTGAYNRRAGEERLAEDLARSARDGGSLTLAILDADGLKEVNDSFGHAAGDACLRHLTDALRRNVREGDWVARWGGDEFVVGLWDADDGPDSPRTMLERVARDLRNGPIPLPDREGLRPTFSAGLSRSVPGETPGCLLDRADGLLYRAKREGRARIVPEP